MHFIYLMRHGDAGPAVSGGSDRDRTLTDFGRQQIYDHCLQFKQEGEPIDLVIHSPYLRAAETASIVAHQLTLKTETNGHLTPGGSVDHVITAMAGETRSFLLVSHLPLIAELARALVGKQIGFYPASCIKAVCADPFQFRGELEWVRHQV